MKKILVAYATNSGSTVEVAQAVGEELGRNGAQVEIRQVHEVPTVEGYDAVVVGAPMIMGWHRSAVNFVKKHRQGLRKVQVAYFLTAISLVKNDLHLSHEAPIWVDPKLAKPPQKANRMNFKERHTTIEHYLHPVLKAAPEVKPVSVGFFGGMLDLSRLSWWQKLFVSVVIQAQPGEYRNWPFIRDWSTRLGEL